MTTEKRGPGRPRGNRWPNTRHVRLTDQELEWVKALAERWGVSEAAAVRLAVRQAAKKERVE